MHVPRIQRRLTTTVSPTTSSTTTGVFSAIASVLAPARDLVDQLFADRCTAPGRRRRPGIAMTTRPDLPDEILRAAVGGCLLAVEEAREEVDRRRQDHAAQGADDGRRQRAEAVVCGYGAKPAERRDEDADHARAEEPRARRDRDRGRGRRRNARSISPKNSEIIRNRKPTAAIARKTVKAFSCARNP